MNTSKSSSTGWRTVALEEVVTRLTNGYVGPTRDIYVPQGIPYLLARHVKDNRLTFDGKTFVSPEFNREHSKSILKEGDVLMVQSGHIGETAVVSKAHEGHNCHALIVISPKKDKLLGSYLSYYFNSLIGRRELEKFETGITLKHLNCKDVRTVKIPLPPLEEQKRIAAIAQKADRLRRTRRYALQLGDTYLQSVFFEMFGNPVTNPKGWKTTELEGLCELIVDCPHSTPIYAEKITAFPCIRTSDIQKGFIDWSTTKYVNEDEYFKRITRYKPQTGDVLYTREGERFGLAARVPKTTTLCLGQRMMLLKANPKIANGEFLCALMNSSGVYQQASNLVGGSTSPHVNVGDIKCFKAFMPPLPLQEKFAQIVQKFERLRTQQWEGDRQAEHLFQTLLHRAFRGELTPQDANDQPASVLLEQIRAEQAQAEAEAKAATQAMGEAAEYLGTKAKQQDTEPIQLTLPGIE